MKPPIRPSLLTVILLGLAAGGSASAASYAQDFTFADGTTDFGDGSTVAGTDGVNQVVGQCPPHDRNRHDKHPIVLSDPGPSQLLSRMDGDL